MALPIRQGATHKVVIGPVVAVANGYVPVTSLTLSGADEAEAILHDNGTVVDISAYTFAAITTADGYYHLTLQSGISNTVGHLTIVINDDSLCLPVRADFVVLEEAVYDQMYAASAPGAATVAALSTMQGNVTDILADTAEIGAAGAGLTNINLPNQTMDIVGNITGNLSGSVGSVTGAVGSVTGNVGGNVTGSVGSVVGAVGSVTGAVGSVTGNVGGNVTGSVGSLAAQAKLDVNAEVDTAIETYHLDHLLAVTYDPASKPGVADALLNELVESDAGVSRFTANALEQAPTGGSAPTAAAIADAVWDEAQADHVTAGSFGVLATEIADILVDTAEIGAAGAGLTALATAAALATVDGIVDDILVDTATLGTPAGADFAADIAAIKTETAEILSDTGATLDTKINAIDTVVDSILLQTGTNGVKVDLTQALDATPTADTVGDALWQATLETAPKKNVALADIPFYMVDATDGYTPETGLTVTAEVSKDGAAFAAATGSVTERSVGVYHFDASQADMNADSVLFKFTATGARPAFVAISTVA